MRLRHAGVFSNAALFACTAAGVCAVTSPARADAQPRALVLPVAPVEGVSPEAAVRMGQGIATHLTTEAPRWSVGGPDVAKEVISAECLATLAGGGRARSVGADSDPADGDPSCACSEAGAKGWALLVQGRLRRDRDQFTFTLGAHRTLDCTAVSKVPGGATPEPARGVWRSGPIGTAVAAAGAGIAARALVSEITGLRATCLPPAAEIFVDHEARGVGRVELNLPLGSHVIEARLAGYTTERRKVEIVAAETAEVAITLRPLGPSSGPGGGGGEDRTDGTGGRAGWQTPVGIGALTVGGVLGVLVLNDAAQIGDCQGGTCYEAGTGFALTAIGAGVLIAAGAALLLVDLGPRGEPEGE